MKAIQESHPISHLLEDKLKHTHTHKDIKDFFKDSQYHMVDVSQKKPTFRRAVAMGRIQVGNTAFTHIQNKTLPKGDVLKIAEIAGIQGAKNAWQQMPMCHPLPLDHVAIHLELDEENHAVTTFALVSTTAKTGVEMEALAAVNASLLTLYDLTKPVEPALTISGIRLLIKEGGKKGIWIHPDGIPEKLQDLLPMTSQRPLENRSAAIITMSDRAYNGNYEDLSGAYLRKALKELGCNVLNCIILPDEAIQLEETLKSLAGQVEFIITTGGTGLSPRDITPEVIEKLSTRTVPGIGELLRYSGSDHMSTAWLSRSLAGVIDTSLVIALPGSVNAVKHGLEMLKAILPHALDHIQNKKHIHEPPVQKEKNV